MKPLVTKHEFIFTSRACSIQFALVWFWNVMTHLYLFCSFLNVERCMWKGGMGELREGTVSGRGSVRRGEVGREKLRGGEKRERKIMEFLGD